MDAPARPFFASAPRDDQRRALVVLQQRLADALPGIPLEWTADTDLHLTLRFLGDTPRRSIADLGDCLDRSARRHAPMHVFGGRVQDWSGRRGTLFVVEFDRSTTLDALVADLEQQAVALRYAAESRAFRPHITLARGRGPTPAGVVAAMNQAPLDIAIDSIDLYARVADREGVRYCCLHRAPLR